jgi:CheY-like chemotaxis protein
LTREVFPSELINYEVFKLKETKNLLLVDDTELFLAMEKSFLERRQFILHTAKSGSEALEKARTIQPDLILLDLHMPDLSGDQVCSRLKEDPQFQNIPIIIATSEKNRPTLAKCIEAGCDAILPKPFDKEVLVRTVLEVLVVSQRQSRRVEVQIPCTVRIEDEELQSTIKNISEGGAFIEIGIPLEKESILELDFILPHADSRVSAQIIVRWASSFMRMSAHAGMGVEFLTVTQGERDLIRSFVETQHREKMRRMIGVEEEK